MKKKTDNSSKNIPSIRLRQPRRPDVLSGRQDLRRQAEAKLDGSKAPASATKADALRLAHELQVHQIELEMQNEELIRSRAETEAALRQYEDLYDFAPVGYFTLARDSAIHQVNLAGAELLGMERSKLIKRRLGLFVSSTSRPVFNAFLEKVFVSAEKETCEVELLKGKTKSFWAQIEAAVKDERRETARIALVDITTRKHAEEVIQKSHDELERLVQQRTAELAEANKTLHAELAALKHAEDQINRMALMLDTAPNSITVHDFDGRFLYANQRTFDLHGFTRDEFMALNLREIDVPDSAKLIASRMRELLDRGEAIFQASHYRKDGSTLPLEITAKSADWGGKKVIFSIATDITERKRAEEALKESEWRNRVASELTTDYIFVVDVDPGGILKLRWAADNMYRLTGRTVEDAATSDLWGNIIHPDDAADFFGFVNQILSTAQSNNLECRTFHKSGEERWVGIFARPQVGEDGSVKSIVGAIQDITERKRAEEALKESEWRSRIVSELTTDYIFVVDVDPGGRLKFHWVSENIFSMTGRMIEDASTFHDWKSLIHPDDEKLFFNFMDRILSTDTAGDLEFRAFPNQGGERWVRVFARPQVGAGNNVKTIVGAVQDITARKQAEQALKESNDRFQNLAANIPANVAYVNANTLQYEFVNAVFEKSFGLPREKIIGSHIKEIIGETNYRFALKYIEEVRLGKSVSYENTFDLVSGKRWIEVNYAPYFDANGQIASIVVLSYDITDHKRLEESLRVAEADYRDIFERAPVGIFRSTVDGYFMKVNHVMAEMYGYSSPEEMLADVKSIAAQIYAEPMLREELAYLLAKHREVLGFESLDRRKNDSAFWTSMNARAVKNADGKILYYEGFVTDITERKRIEMELLENQIRTRAMLRAIPDLVFRMDSQGVFLDYKADIRDLYAQTESIIGKRSRDITPPEFADLIERQIRATLETSALQTFEYQLPVPGKGLREYEARMTVSGLDEVTAIVRDVTERKQVEEAVRLSEARYRQAITAAGAVPYYRDYQNDTQAYTFMGEGILQLTGYSAAEITPAIFDQLEQESVMRGALAHLAPDEAGRLSEAGKISHWACDYRILTRDGQTRWVADSAVQVRDENNRRVGVIGILQDITERKQVEEALRENEENLRVLFETMSEGIALNEMIYDENGEMVDYRILNVNQAFYSTADYRGNNVIGNVATKLYGISPELIKEFWKRHKERESTAYTEMYTPLDNHCFFVATSPFVNNRFVTSFFDITERKRAEKALQESEEKLRGAYQYARSLIEASLDPLVTISAEGKITDVNLATENATGLSRNELIGTDFADYFTDPDKARAGYLSVFEKEYVIDYPLTIRHISNKLTDVLYNARIYHDEQGKVLGVFAAARDVTEPKRAEMERQVLLEIMQGLITTDNLREFLELIRLSINKVTPAENYFVVLYNQKTELFEEIYAVDKYDAPMPPSKLEKSITAYVFRMAKALLLDQKRFDELVAQGEVELVGTDSTCWLGAPLQTPDKNFGVIAIQDYENPKCYSERDKDFLTFIGAQVALGIERKQAQEELVAARESLRLANLGLRQALEREQFISRTDSLTNTHNRRYFFEFATHEFTMTKRYKTPLSMIMFDIDHFKQFNDLYGHQTGDEVLIHVAQVAQEQLRDADILARYGGEEFVVLLPNSNAQEAAVVAERIREAIAAYQMDINGKNVSITISAGVVERVTSTGSVDHMIQQADKAMYAAKSAGRNCVEIYSAE
jgi:diguanylate cyclase (GGDEF)-like protein/PAS domain S-box-containing protein